MILSYACRLLVHSLLTARTAQCALQEVPHTVRFCIASSHPQDPRFQGDGCKQRRREAMAEARQTALFACRVPGWGPRRYNRLLQDSLWHEAASVS